MQARTPARREVTVSFFQHSKVPAQTSRKSASAPQRARASAGEAIAFQSIYCPQDPRHNRVFPLHLCLPPHLLLPRKPHKRTQERLWTCLGREHAPAGRYLRRGHKEGPVADEQGGNARYHPDELACKRSSASSLRQGHQSNDFAD